MAGRSAFAVFIQGKGALITAQDAQSQEGPLCERSAEVNCEIAELLYWVFKTNACGKVVFIYRMS